MTPEEIDKLLAQAANQCLSPGADRAAKTRAQSAILTDLHPIRPLAPSWVFTLLSVALFALLASATTTALGLHEIRVLSLSQRALIFPALLVAAWLAAAACAREMRPADGTRLGALVLISSATAIPVVFSLAFHGDWTVSVIAAHLLER